MRSVLATLLVVQLAGWAPAASAEEADAGGSAPFAETVFPPVLDVRAARIEIYLPDGGVGPEVDVAGGAWWSTETTLATGKRIAGLEAENSKLTAAPVATPKWVFAVVVGGLVVGLAGGFYLGWTLHKEITR